MNAFSHYFRHGHISMAPALAPQEFLTSLFASSKTQGNYAQTFALSLNSNQITTTFNGSAALYQVAQKLSLSEGDVIFLPAYCCGAEIGPFKNAGCDTLFYDVDAQLNANIAQIEELLKTRRNIKALLITHYFGFAQIDIDTIQRLCRQYNTALIEDCAHALYCSHSNSPLGSYGQYAIFSPRKTLPLSEGGLLVENNREATVTDSAAKLSTPLKQPDFLPWLQRVCYSIQQYFRSKDVASTNRLIPKLGIALWAIPAAGVKILKKIGFTGKTNWLTADAEGNDAIPIYDTSMSKSMFSLLKQSQAESIIETRRRNYTTWLSELSSIGDLTSARPLFTTLPPGCCPLYFPLVVDEPAKLVAALKLADIESFNWWQHLHPSVEWQHFPIAKGLKQTIVALPTHQKLTAKQITQAATCVKYSILNSR